MSDLIFSLQLDQHIVGHLSSAIQFGFITGTFCFALLNLADRVSPSKLFFFCAILASLTNLTMLWDENSFGSLMLFRFLTGFFLAGIYPVGMKIAADYFQKGLGVSLGFLVGALVLGTSFPHFLSAFEKMISWQNVVVFTSFLSVIGGAILFLFVPDGPHRFFQQSLDLKACFRIFKKPNFRTAAFGYFGHMWELYTFWTFVPIILLAYKNQNRITELNVALQSFFIIGIGSLACVISSYVSTSLGEKRTAFGFLMLSMMSCLVFPLFYYFTSVNVFLCFMFFWGMVVIGDSPLFSTLVARNTDAKIKGTALTMVNCIGFSITIISIQCFSWLYEAYATFHWFLLLALGPIVGLLHFYLNERKAFGST